jgi:protein phosphatase 1L
MILNDRVGGSLAVTRAFGDHALKSEGVTAKPSINKHVLRPFDKFLIIASDGVWDVLEDQDAVNFCKDEYSAKDLVVQIVKTSVDKGSKDNISCIVVKFHSASPF